MGGLTKISLFELTKRFIKEIGLPTDLIECTDADSTANPIDYSLNFSETLNLVEAEPLLLEQSFNLFQ